MKDTKSGSGYSIASLNKSDKRALALIVALSFAFNVGVFSPVDFYLNNLVSVILPYKVIILSCLPVAVLLFLAVFLTLRLTKGYAHLICLSVMVGINTAMYIQGNYLTIGTHVLDGTPYSASAVRIIADVLMWAVLIAVPFVIYKKSDNVFKGYVTVLSCAVILIEITALISDVITASSNYLDVVPSNDYYLMSCDTSNEFTYSKEKNHIVIVVDQYDSFIFDNAVSKEPDSVSGFDGFTYYNNTIGMYKYTDPSLAFLFTNKLLEDGENLSEHYQGDTLFDHIPDDYSVELYCSNNMFPYEVMQKNADNFNKDGLSLGDYVRVSSAMYSMVMYRVVPDIAKSPFEMYSEDFTEKISDLESYNTNNKAFYESLPAQIKYTDKPCYKLYYLRGIHIPRVTNENIEYEKNVKPTESGIGVNKILSRFFDLLKEGGVYDNSDIILLADHGHRPNYEARYPLLMIKRANDTSKGIKTSSAQISYADFFPTCCYLLGDETAKEKSIFEIPEGLKRDRYFAALDEHTYEDVDRTLPLDESGL